MVERERGVFNKEMRGEKKQVEPSLSLSVCGRAGVETLGLARVSRCLNKPLTRGQTRG